ncbi:MAG: IS110 family transposase [Polaromonas sp.]|jgi:transposase|nr:IS110 family transposase [Polaromonas sp.]
MMSSHPIDTPAAGEKDATLYVAFELSKSKWLIGMVVSGESKMSRHQVVGGDTAAVWQLISKKRAYAEKQGRRVRVVSCYEAGYDGFWFDRWLAEQGVANRVLDPSSIEMPRRARQAKTDRLDLERLMRVLIRHEGGEPKVCSVVHPPTPEQEDARRVSRERDRLIGERTAHVNRIKGLLHGQGIRDVHPRRKGFLEQLAQLRTGDGRAVPANLAAEIQREHARLVQVGEQIAEVESQMKAERAAAAPDSRASQVNQLISLKSVGPVGGETLVNEVFWRDFQNRRQVGGYFGLAGTPFDSGQSSREQGISKAGNARARTLAIELSWLWLRYQPASTLSLWFTSRVGDQKGRVRRIAIVALARKLMVALWRFLTQGLVPEGARLRAAAPAGR